MLARRWFTRASTSGYFHLIRKLAALVSLAVVLNGSFAQSTQSLEAKNSRNSSRRARNYFVPPPPPYAPSALGMTNAQAVLVAADDAVVETEAKTSRNSSRRNRDYFVPPPPPYTPSMVPSALGMTNAQAVTADADDAVLEKAINLYSKYILTHNQGDMPQVVRSNPYTSYSRGAETKILKQIDDFDSEISSHEEEIGKLLNL